MSATSTLTNFRLRTRLYLGFVSLIVVALLLAGVGCWGIGQLGGHLAKLKLANAAKATEKPPQHVLDLSPDGRRKGKGLRETARELNRLNIRTPRGCLWHACTVRAQPPPENPVSRNDCTTEITP